MKKLRFITVILIVIFLVLPTFAQSGMIIEDYSTYYEYGKANVQLKQYEAAYDWFVKSGDYLDSRQWSVYCEALSLIFRANEYEVVSDGNAAYDAISKAKEMLLPLSNMHFEDSEVLLSYCSARINEMNYFIQVAIDSYAELGYVLDSYDRYQALSNGKSPQAVHASESELATLVRVAGSIYSSNKLYAGPGGKEYGYEKGITVSAGDPIVILAKIKEWYLIELSSPKACVWIPSIRIVRENDTTIPELRKQTKQSVLHKDTTVLYGPGNDYLTREQLNKGDKVFIYCKDGDYSIIEYKINSTSFIGWILTDCLSY